MSIGIQNDIDSLITRINYFLDQKYRRIKIKVEPGWDIDVIKTIRSELGEIPLMIDANSEKMVRNTLINSKEAKSRKKKDSSKLKSQYKAQRTRNIFSPVAEKPYKLSRSRIENFMRCNRCFFLVALNFTIVF